MAARCACSCPANTLGSACSAIVVYPRMSDISTVTVSSSVSPGRRPCSRIWAATPPGRKRLRDSPCSFRSTIARWSSLETVEAVGASGRQTLGEGGEERVDRCVDSGGSRLAVHGDRLDRATLGDLLEEILFVRRQRSSRPEPEWSDPRRSSGRAWTHRRRPREPRGRQLVPLADPILEEVRVAGGAFRQQ